MNSLREIKDECSRCGEILQCELCREGHGIKCERQNVAEMVKCQLDHMMKKDRA